MTRDNVISFEQNLGGVRRGIGEKKMRDLVAKCREQLADNLPRLMQDLFEHVDDELYQLADKSASDVLQTRYFEAMRELRKQRDGIERTFIVGRLDQFDRFWLEPVQATPEPVLGDEDELSLVDQDELEENLAVSSMVSKAENRYHRELFAMNMRFAQLVGVSDLSSRQNPVGPYALAEGFRAALRQWTGDLGVRLVILKLFDRNVMGYAGGIYDDLNAHLVAAGILPKIVQTVRRNPVAPSVQRARGDSDAGEAVTAGTAVEGAEQQVSQQQVLGMLTEMLSAQRDRNAGRLFSARLPGGGGGQTHLPAVESTDLLEALHALQRDIHADRAVSTGEIQQLQGEILLNLGRRLDMGTADMPAKRLQQPDQDVIDVIGMLFDFILDDHEVPDAMKALIGRLQIPMLKVAVLDRTFFANKQHPARQLLNTLARAAMGWVDDGDRSGRSLYGRMESAVARILDEFTDNVELFAEVYDDFSAYVEREARGAEVAEERVTQITRGQEQLLVARRRVAEVLNGFREQQPDLPMAVVNILREGWHDVMLLAYLREGEESAGWETAHETVRALIWSVQPKVETDDRQRLLKSIPDLLKTLRDGLNNISFDQHRAGELFKDLQTCHIAALRGEDGSVETQPTCDAIPEEILAADVEVAPVVEDDALARAMGLQVGQWLEWEHEDERMRGKLSWRSQVTNACIFVNRKGMKVSEMQMNDIALLFRSDRARVLEDMDKPLMDRALDAMVVALHETGGPENESD